VILIMLKTLYVHKCMLQYTVFYVNWIVCVSAAIGIIEIEMFYFELYKHLVNSF